MTDRGWVILFMILSYWDPVCSLVVFCILVGGGNKLAHSLTRRAVLAADTDVWLEQLPQDLVDVI